VAVGIAGAGPCLAGEPTPQSIADLSLEELGNIRITSVSKKEERLADAAAAVYVITSDAIRRSGAHTLPEALRLAPNLQVAQISAYQYAITARGFNSTGANKLLVMIDGRTVYTPLYSGVFWDAQDVLLQDVERIEVISGPGGTLWGANAVNGVINVITKQASATSGDFLQVFGGNIGRGVAVRHATALGDEGSGLRLYAKFDQGHPTVRADGKEAPDAWQRSQVGFRSDWRAAQDSFTLQGDAYTGSADQTAPGQQQISGANLLARWTSPGADGAAWRVQGYLDHTTRDLPGTFSESLNTLDLDVQYELPSNGVQKLVVGGGYRVSGDQVGNSAVLAFLPPHRTLHWANLFVQYERSLQPGLQLTAGIKAESNDYTGVEYLPSLKLAWKPSSDGLLWAGLSRAVRAPSRVDTDFYVPANPPYLLAGGPNFRSEIATTLELGWRALAAQTLSYSLVVYHSDYARLESISPLPSGTSIIGNQISGQVDGLQAWASVQATKSWSLDAGLQLQHDNFSGPNLATTPPGNDPRAQWRLASKWNVGEGCQFDVALRHVGELTTPAVPAYTAVDARFAWRVSRGAELAVTARNLLDARHQEFQPQNSRDRLNPNLMVRSLDVTLALEF
jgi:iron complex outermembrane receptor protein